jgi:hypothetical protein
MGESKNAYKFLVENSGKNLLVDGSIILKWILKE